MLYATKIISCDPVLRFHHEHDVGEARLYRANYTVQFDNNSPLWMDISWPQPVRDWMKAHISIYCFEDRYILFNRYEDALLCYMRFAGKKKEIDI